MTQQVLYPDIVAAKSAVSTALRQMGIPLGEGHGAHMQLGKYSHFYYVNAVTKKKYWIKKVHKPFITFGMQFKEYSGQVGETLDKEVLDMLDDRDTVYFAYDNAIYYVDVETFREYARNRPNDADGGIQTVSIPICLLESFL